MKLDVHDTRPILAWLFPKSYHLSEVVGFTRAQTLFLPDVYPNFCCSGDPDQQAAMFFAYIPPNVYSARLKSTQGKVAELRLELNGGGKKDKNYSGKKIALKKIVANMTMSNNDMVALFPDIIGCMHIQSLEIKKM